MPLRSNPTARQQRLGAEVRRMRERAGITARAAAAFLGSSPMYQSHVETGRSGISEERIRRLAAHCGCDDVAYVDALVSMANERGKGWWEGHRGVIDPLGLALAECEHHATRIRTFQVVHIPGLLQIEDHIRAAFRFIDPARSREMEDAHVTFRSLRQQVIIGERARPYEALIHEAALRIQAGGRKTALAQLEHIADLSGLPNVTIRVIPFASQDFAGGGYPLLYLSGPVTQLDTAQADTPRGSVFFDEEQDLGEYRARYERVEQTALPADKSRELISRLIREL
ncbi:helix-turn-helix domain-containing protein [Streptomyces sp. NPDC013978]|uniref:helix-turn-helix domain-containing protein n=1 Tax=Streptomyces sp. NPDC013978 TaxID=3364869 RepID=UPI0036FABD49